MESKLLGIRNIVPPLDTRVGKVDLFSHKTLITL